jgi:hypothetical protein
MKVPLPPLQRDITQAPVAMTLAWRNWFSTLINALSSAVLATKTITGNYTTLREDAGSLIIHQSALAHTVDIETSAAIGAELTIVNGGMGGLLTIDSITATLVWSPGGSATARVLAPWGVAHLLKIGEVEWIIYGTGIS